ncbi:MAG: DUF5063 domain-containing protein [Muribaculaceae bacterium]|nr:DUF5063 domain-containing protein [Muribaculaceae bacterium]
MTPNSLAFIALCNEYCASVEHARETGHDEFVDSMLRLLPRLYITASDLPSDITDPDAYIADALEEDYYESVRRSMEEVLGEDDAYLEVFEEDMKYSDTPIAASVAEGLADIFQVLYNFVDTVREAPDELASDAIAVVKEDFGSYWSKPLCNVLRALNNIKY